MKFESFREILIKKAGDDSTLQTFIRYVRDEVIADSIMESLEKMARAGHKGDAANFAVRDFGTEMDPETEPHMVREALGHHVSRYKAALGANRQDVANQHARQAFKLMNMADIAQKHSGGKLSIEHVSPHPWERNKYTSQYAHDHPKVQEGKYKPGDFVTKTKGLNYSGNDFSFLQQAPHESYKKEIKRHGHAGAYPFEQIRINGKYIPLEDIKDIKGYEKHPFDEHPIMSHYSESAKSRTPEADKRYLEERDKYMNEQPHVGQHFERMSALEAADPEAFKTRGEKAGDPVHKEVPRLKLEDDEAPVAEDQPKAAASKDENNIDLSTLDPETREKILAMLKGGK